MKGHLHIGEMDVLIYLHRELSLGWVLQDT